MDQKKVFVLVGVVVVLVCGLLLFGESLAHQPIGNGSSKITQTASVVPFTTLVQSTQQKITDRTNYIIASQRELEDLWQMIVATGTPPAIDFSTHEVLAVFSGDPESSAVQVSRIEDGAQRDVLVTIVTLDGACTSKRAGVPYELISVPIANLPLTHTDVAVTAACPE